MCWTRWSAHVYTDLFCKKWNTDRGSIERIAVHQIIFLETLANPLLSQFSVRYVMTKRNSFSLTIALFLALEVSWKLHELFTGKQNKKQNLHSAILMENVFLIKYIYIYMLYMNLASAIDSAYLLPTSDRVTTQSQYCANNHKK